MKKLLFLSLILVTAVILSGCGKTAGNLIKSVDMTQTAKDITQASQNANQVDSEENINNIIKMMNYEGLSPEDDQNMKAAVKKGIDDGKDQAEIDKELITSSAKDDNNFGTGYMLGYTFGCKAATGDEAKCNKEIGQKYQAIFIEEFQNLASTSGNQIPQTNQ